MIQDTSLEAYLQIQPHLKPCQQRIFRFMQTCRDRDFTNKQLAYELRWPINTVTPRILELRRMGLVVFSKIIVQENGRRAMAWKVKV
jgi:transcription initiation factor IIE alpha subunit